MDNFLRPKSVNHFSRIFIILGTLSLTFIFSYGLTVKFELDHFFLFSHFFLNLTNFGGASRILDHGGQNFFEIFSFQFQKMSVILKRPFEVKFVMKQNLKMILYDKYVIIYES